MENTTNTSEKQFRILGLVDWKNECDCCGKENLKKTVALENNETGEVVYYGTTCAAAANKYRFETEAKKVKSEITRIVKRRADLVNFSFLSAARSLKEEGIQAIEWVDNKAVVFDEFKDAMNNKRFCIIVSNITMWESVNTCGIVANTGESFKEAAARFAQSVLGITKQ